MYIRTENIIFCAPLRFVQGKLNSRIDPDRRGVYSLTNNYILQLNTTKAIYFLSLTLNKHLDFHEKLSRGRK